MRRLLDRLISLLFVAIVCGGAVAAVHDGNAWLALSAGFTLGLLAAALVVQFVRWREKTRSTGP